MKHFELKSDKFRRSRGGYSRILEVFCRKCRCFLLTYQKDGSGNLRRLYLDRILSESKKTNVLKCKKCGEILGTLHVYKKENRKAYRLYQDTVTKRIRRL